MNQRQREDRTRTPNSTPSWPLHTLLFALRRRKSLPSPLTQSTVAVHIPVGTGAIHPSRSDWNQDTGFKTQQHSSPEVPWRKFSTNPECQPGSSPESGPLSQTPGPALACCSARRTPSPMAHLLWNAGPTCWRGHSSLNQGRAPSRPSHPTPNASCAPVTESSQVTGERKMTNM